MRFLPKIPFGGVALFLGAGLSACSTDTASQARPAMATEAEFEVAMDLPRISMSNWGRAEARAAGERDHPSDDEMWARRRG